jgi:hypothetical protein
MSNFSKFHENPFSSSQILTGKHTRANDGKHNSGSFHCKTRQKFKSKVSKSTTSHSMTDGTPILQQ